MASDLQFQWLPSEHIDKAHEIEKDGYPADESASLQAFRDRQILAPQLFLGAYAGIPSDESLIGYICATRSSSDILTHETMCRHETDGPSICIHSVCVDVSHRRNGVASKMLGEYVERLSKDPSAQQLLLIAHEELVPFYERAGFEYRGKSTVAHGSRPWFELRLILRHSSSSIPPEILAVLSKPSQSKPKVDFAHIEPLVLKGDVSNNPNDLLCPHPSCGCIIVRKDVGRFHLRPAEVDLNPLKFEHSFLSPLPVPPTEVSWWLITPSPMEFENISFSRPVISAHTEKSIKYLACADCDIGPLGWCYEGSSEFWLAAARVAYGQG